MPIFWYKSFQTLVDSRLRGNDDFASFVIPGEAIGCDPESRLLSSSAEELFIHDHTCLRRDFRPRRSAD